MLLINVCLIHAKNIDKQWILRYLRDTIGVCLEFGRSKDGLLGYVDADYVGDRDKRRSMAGFIFSVGGCTVS